MNAGTAKLIMATAAVCTAGLAQRAFADGGCHDVKAKFTDVYNGGATTSGKMTNGGVLDGWTATVYNSQAFPTPSSTIVSYSAELTLTTGRGQVKISQVYLYDFATGQGTVLGYIDPKTSTGRFTAATGTLFFNETKTVGTSAPFTYLYDISGQICLAGN